MGTTFTLIGSRARKRRAAFSSNLSVVPTPLSNLTFCKILTSAIFISRSANRMPIHWRGPWLKGMYEKDGRFLTSLGRKRSGSKVSGCVGESKDKRLKTRKPSIDSLRWFFRNECCPWKFLKLSLNLLYQALFGKSNRSSCSLKRCDGPILLHLCLYSC